MENKKEIKKNIKSMGWGKSRFLDIWSRNLVPQNFFLKWRYLRERFMAGVVALKKIERFQVILHNYAASFWS